ncbi:MAG: RHS repeat domain-containing protein, partial [Lawsonibacter sp.]|nr:RHS repeat domain-containing protein [Lawsonibacter sp.]
MAGSPGYDAGVLAVQLAYDNRGRVVGQTDQKGNTNTYAYNAVGKVSQVTNSDGGQNLYVYQYAYNNEFNTVQFTNELDHVMEYRYDTQGNLRE